MAFWVRPENGNSGGVAHGGMLMSIADYCLCSVAMESKENYAATIKFYIGIRCSCKGWLLGRNIYYHYKRNKKSCLWTGPHRMRRRNCL